MGISKSKAPIYRTIASLPRFYRGSLNARVWVDDSGRLCIDLEGGGTLILEDEYQDFLDGGEDT